MFQPVSRALDRGARPERQGAIVPVVEREARAGEPGALVCAACGYPITTAAARTERFDAHVHVFTNPDGLRFEIGCFVQAPGVRLIGEETLAFTWFPSFAWTVALCARCGVQLGWRYRSSSGAEFHGLILERLREVGGSDPVPGGAEA